MKLTRAQSLSEGLTTEVHVRSSDKSKFNSEPPCP